MSEDVALSIGAEALRVIFYLSAPMLVAAMVVGIVVSVLQAITQINEATLTFIPKMIAIVLVLVVMAPWMLRVLEDYAVNVIGQAGEVIRQ